MTFLDKMQFFEEWSISALKSSLLGTSGARHFYQYMFFNVERNSGKHQNLLSRARDSYNAHKISFIKYVCDDKHARACKTTISNRPRQADGVTDSIKYLLTEHYL